MGPVGHQRRALKDVREDLLARGSALRLVHAREPVLFERIGGALDDERAHPRRVAVVVGVERASFGADERLGQRVERASRTEPGEVVVEVPEARREGRFVRAADQGVEAVGAHDQVPVQLVEVPNRMREADRRPERFRARAQDLDELQSPDGGKPDAVDRSPRPADG